LRAFRKATVPFEPDLGDLAVSAINYYKPVVRPTCALVFLVIPFFSMVATILIKGVTWLLSLFTDCPAL